MHLKTYLVFGVPPSWFDVVLQAKQHFPKNRISAVAHMAKSLYGPRLHWQKALVGQPIWRMCRGCAMKCLRQTHLHSVSVSGTSYESQNVNQQLVVKVGDCPENSLFKKERKGYLGGMCFEMGSTANLNLLFNIETYFSQSSVCEWCFCHKHPQRVPVCFQYTSSQLLRTLQATRALRASECPPVGKTGRAQVPELQLQQCVVKLSWDWFFNILNNRIRPLGGLFTWFHPKWIVTYWRHTDGKS